MPFIQAFKVKISTTVFQVNDHLRLFYLFILLEMHDTVGDTDQFPSSKMKFLKKKRRLRHTSRNCLMWKYFIEEEKHSPGRMS